MSSAMALERRLRPLGQLDAARLPIQDRLGNWTAATARFLVPLRITAQAETVNGTIRADESEGVRLCRITASAHDGERTAELAERDAVRYVKFAIPLGRRVTVAQHGRRITLAPGELCLYRTSAPYAVGSDAPLDFAIGMVPEDAIPLNAARLDELAATRLRGEGIAALRATLLRVADAGITAFERDRSLDRLVAVRPEGEVLDRALRARYDALRQRAEHLIRERIATPWLTPDYLADALAVSRRTLYAAFSTDGRTVAGTIRHARLDHARDLLQRLAPEGSSVSEIAARSGFQSAAHFSRLYRAEFGRPPSRDRPAASA
ncbi:MAG TPA: helix-turn-helix domain-containing protein [Microbacteriaceae bacterium]|nr:helix-turn-helix domain-containing protein [Microbacteriaceae bacterium]